MNIPQIIVAKSISANFTASGGSATAFSTNGRIKIDNRSSKDSIAASNLHGGVDRPLGIRELNGYIWDYGDVPPLNSATSLPVKPNDLIDIAFTLDGATAVQVASSGTGVRIRALEVFVNPYTEDKENVVYYVVHIGGAGTDFSAGPAAGPNFPTDPSTPKIYSTKSLGVQFAYWNASTHALVWSAQCYYAGMHLKIQALADPDWSSCLNGVAYYPEGNYDFSLELGKRTNVWPIPTTPLVAPPMLSGQPITSPFAGPGTPNGDGDLVFPDLDSIVGVRMVTQVNADLTPKAYWQLLYCVMSDKSGEFNQKSTKPISVEYLLEKCGSPPSKNTDTGYDVGSISYVTGVASNGTGGTTYQLWP